MRAILAEGTVSIHRCFRTRRKLPSNGLRQDQFQVDVRHETYIHLSEWKSYLCLGCTNLSDQVELPAWFQAKDTTEPDARIEVCIKLFPSIAEQSRTDGGQDAEILRRVGDAFSHETPRSSDGTLIVFIVSDFPTYKWNKV